jgi:KaiC/GvpD/RAD55 family RecA-like ATPase
MIDLKIIEKELNNLPIGYIVLLETSAENSIELGLGAIKFLTNKSYNGIVLSASRPFSNLISLYKKNSIDIKKLFFLDCVSKSKSAKSEEDTNVLYLRSVSDLTNISISLSKAINSVKGNKFIFIDSITTMLIYNKPSVFAMFIHSIMTRMRTYGISGLLISLQSETNKEIRAEILQLCDKVIKF